MADDFKAGTVVNWCQGLPKEVYTKSCFKGPAGVVVDAPKKGCKPNEVAFVQDNGRHTMCVSKNDIAHYMPTSNFRNISMFSQQFKNGDRVVYLGERIGTVVHEPEPLARTVDVVFDGGEGKIETIPADQLSHGLIINK